METSKFKSAIALIDKKNSEDIHLEIYQDKAYPKELLYSHRMTQKLLEFYPEASEELQIAARAQHICRWKIARNNYPMGKIGYIQWREKLKTMHAEITSGILNELGYNSEFIEKVAEIVTKRRIKKDKDVQMLEDVVCLIFLQYYFESFATKHKDKKIIDILRKTWRKMSTKGQAEAKKLSFSPKNESLVKRAILND